MNNTKKWAALGTTLALSFTLAACNEEGAAGSGDGNEDDLFLPPLFPFR